MAHKHPIVMGLLIVVLLALAACNLTGSGDSTALNGDSTLVVAWVENGNLMLWRQGDDTPRQIASGGVVRPYIAPDGQHIAFTRGPQGAQEALWIVDAAGTVEQELAGRDDLRPLVRSKPLIHQVEWYDEAVLYFNTLKTVDVGLDAQDDLYRANIRTREVALMLPPTEGGQFTISPDKQHIVVVYPGTYGRRDGRIRVIDPLVFEPARNLLFFVGVSTASEYDFYPAVYWEPDSTAVRAAIPDPNLVYDDTQPTALWRLPIDNPQDRALIGEITASFFGQPRWSDSGRHMLYVQRVGDPTTNQFEVEIADANGETPAAYASGQAGAFEPPQWIPGRDLFFYAQGEPGVYWLGEPGAAPKRLPTESDKMFSPLFIDSTHYVFATTPAEGGVELRYARLDAVGSASTLLVKVNTLLPLFDAVIVSTGE